MGRFALSNCRDTLAYGPGVFPFSVCEAILAIETRRVWASPTVLGLWATPTGVELWALPTEVVFLTPSIEVSGWAPPIKAFSKVCSLYWQLTTLCCKEALSWRSVFINSFSLAFSSLRARLRLTRFV